VSKPGALMVQKGVYVASGKGTKV